jgi:hypothetical protein
MVLSRRDCAMRDDVDGLREAQPKVPAAELLMGVILSGFYARKDGAAPSTTP